MYSPPKIYGEKEVQIIGFCTGKNQVYTPFFSLLIWDIFQFKVLKNNVP